MPTLLQSIETFISNISVTDRQEDNIKQSLANIEQHLLNKENNLKVSRVFTNGSYERDTIIRPLNDIDLFAVFDLDDWKDEYGNVPSPQSVLTKFKNYLNGLNDYKDKVKQDRPCVTVVLSNKNFDILPSIKQPVGYLIPNHDLLGWTTTQPEQLTTNLNDANKKCKYRLKPLIKAIKHWNRENNKLIPSYHIEETAISMFQIYGFVNYEEGIRTWFDKAESYLQSGKFKSLTDHESAINKIKRVKKKLIDAKALLDDGKEGEAIGLWKEVFQKDFPTVNVEEAKKFSKALSEGGLKVGASGLLSTTEGSRVTTSKGFYGGVSGE